MSKCWYCNEELTTGNYDDKHIGICKDCYNGMFRNGNELISKFITKISDLEAKLAEKDLRIEELESQFAYECECNKQFVDCQKENTQLKQQLAEKEKELHYKTAECEKWKADYENCSRLEKLMTKEHQYCLDNWIASDQNKISFCIEQLEKVKELAEDILDDAIKNCSLNESYYDNLLDYIDNQIKQLKEKHEKQP